MGTLVMKFGGQSVGTTTALTQVLSIILHEYEHWERLFIVVSALEGVTDALIEATHLAQVNNRRGYRRIAATLRTRHLSLVDYLPLSVQERQHAQADIDRLLMEMLDELQAIADPNTESHPSQLDRVVSVGERLTARIVTAMIRNNNIRTVDMNASSLIVTDSNFGNANPNIDASCEKIEANLLPMLDRKTVPVITGFIGADRDGNITTMGRGGSDYTASILGICTQADEIWIWSNVDGMMTTDPRDIDTAKVIPNLSYDEVAEMAYFGARVLHAKMIRPIQHANIPLRVKNVFKPQQIGTLIQQERNTNKAPKAVTVIQGIGLSSHQNGPLVDISGMVNDILLQTAGSHAEVMLSSQSSSKTFLCFVIPTTSGPDAARATLGQLNRKIDATNQAWEAQLVQVVTVVGQDINRPTLTAKIYQTLGNDIPIFAVAHGPANNSLSIVTTPDAADIAQERIHAAIIAW